MSEKVNQLQMIEQNLQQLLSQRQQFQGQLVEVESALEELKKSEDAYKIVGNIMIKTAKDDLSKDLNEKKEKAELRVKTIENQESKLKEKAESIRKFNLCGQNVRLKQIADYGKDIENQISKPLFLNTDFEDNVKISNAIRHACSQT